MDFHEQESFACDTRSQRASRIRALNDRLRTERRGGELFITEGICGLHGMAPLIVAAVASFDEFTAGNDPYGEHDFGAFTFQSQKCFWKLDYYATDMCSGAEDPADKYKSLRVLTVMLGSEY